MNLWVTVPFCVLIALSILFLIRTSMVSRLRERLLNEESDWYKDHHDELRDGRRQWGIYERNRRLPSFDVMVLKFWRTMSSFERELGPIEQYYPLIEK